MKRMKNPFALLQFFLVFQIWMITVNKEMCLINKRTGDLELENTGNLKSVIQCT